MIQMTLLQSSIIRTCGEPEIKPPITGSPGSEDGGFDTGNNYNKYNAKCKARIELQGGGGIGALATPIIWIRCKSSDRIAGVKLISIIIYKTIWSTLW